MPQDPAPQLPLIGWREWVALPQLGIDTVKAKVDTGARSSSLHAFDVEAFDRSGAPWVRFVVHPKQRDDGTTVEAEAAVLEYRSVRSSSGEESTRPVILTPVRICGMEYEVELTLANRDAMGFRMLLGREAFRRRFLIDPGRSYCGGRPNRKKRPPS